MKNLMATAATIAILCAAASAQQMPVAMEEIRSSLRGVKDALAAEYEELLRTEPGAAGRVTVSFTIGTDGSISSLAVTCDQVLEPVAEAAENAIAGVSFQPGMLDEPLEISIPFDCLPPTEG